MDPRYYLAKRPHAPKRAAGTLRDYLRRLDTKGSLRLVGLWEHWREVLPPEIASMAEPLGHRGRTLVLASEDPIVVQELSFFSGQILKRVNDYLGEEVFDKVTFELINGRVPLARQPEPARREPPEAPKQPKELGGLLDKFDKESAIGRCYRAYVERFAGRSK